MNTLDSKASRMLLVACCLSAFIFLFLALHSPVAIRTEATHDDALYVRLGQYIADGKWLGPYNEMTLAKGAGYPFFLAVNSWLGLPLTLTQAVILLCGVSAVFYCIAVIYELPEYAMLGFIFVISMPVLFFVRTLRDCIYPSQVLLILALSMSIGFMRSTMKAAAFKAVVLGVVLAWFWVTREEGIWILPGMGILILISFYLNWKSKLSTRFIFALVVAAVAFFSTNGIYRLVNRHHYGAAISVDIKDPNFVGALSELQSVDAGKFTPMVPVSRDVRRAVRQVSPSFELIADYFDPPSGTPWQFGCQVYPDTCGDIAGGWFIWALRDAAASRGFYASPKSASAYFGRMRTEIAAACKSGRLTCRSTAIPFMPRVSLSQIKNAPNSFWNALKKILFVSVHPNFVPSVGDDTQLSRVDRFLGGPVRAMTDAERNHSVFEVRGWFVDRDSGWVHGQTQSSEALSEIIFDRQVSTDLVTVFHRPDLHHSRFNFKFSCGTPCSVALKTDSGATRNVDFDGIVNSSFRMNLGAGTLFFDDVQKISAVEAPSARESVAWDMRTKLVACYLYGMPVLAVLGVICFFVAIGFVIVNRDALLSPYFCVPTICWILIVTRLALLSLIDVSSFPAINLDYLSPLFSLCAIASITSIFFLIAVTRSKNSITSDELAV